jgi:uncharacterized protein (TIGR02231 family)
LYAQPEQLIQTEVENVTVYLNGASVSRSQTLKLSPGTNQFKILGLSSKLDPKSMQLTLSGTAKLVSFYFEKSVIVQASNQSRLRNQSDSLSALETKLQRLRYEMEAFTVEKELLTSNTQRIGQNDGVTTVELTAATSYFRSKLTEVNLKLLEYQERMRPLENRAAALKAQLTSYQSEQNELACVDLSFVVNSPQAMSTALTLRYFVKDVGWAPKYDIRTKGAGSPIELDYRAQLFNLSGEDWQNVRLTLSTAFPNTTMEKPKMDVWGLTFSYNSGRVYKSESSGEEGLLNSRVMRKESSGAATGARETENVLKRVEVNISDISVDFAIKDKYTILSDGRPHIVEVSSYQLPASYSYFSIPKVAQEVYLLGKVTGWESLNLLEGQANVYLDGTFVGQSFIDTRYSNDTLEVVLGVDKKVNIQRVKRVDFNQKKLIGTNRKESFRYEINVRNMHELPIDIEIQDQLPVAQENEITVEDVEISGAEKDEVSGRLKWQLKLEPAKTHTLLLAFSVKYPRNKFVLIRPNRRAALDCPANFW